MKVSSVVTDGGLVGIHHPGCASFWLDKGDRLGIKVCPFCGKGLNNRTTFQIVRRSSGD